MANADCIVIQGSNMAECHPVGFQWVSEAKARGAKIIHIDPRFTRTSAIADTHVPIRAGTDVVLLGALINHVLSNDLYFHDYVVAYTNAATLVSEDFVDTEDLDGVFSGYDEQSGTYDMSSWAYAEREDGEGGRSPSHGVADLPALARAEPAPAVEVTLDDSLPPRPAAVDAARTVVPCSPASASATSSSRAPGRHGTPRTTPWTTSSIVRSMIRCTGRSSPASCRRRAPSSRGRPTREAARSSDQVPPCSATSSASAASQ